MYEILCNALDGNKVGIVTKTDKDGFKLIDNFVDYLRNEDDVVKKYDLAIRIMSNLPIYMGKKKDLKSGDNFDYWYDFTKTT